MKSRLVVPIGRGALIGIVVAYVFIALSAIDLLLIQRSKDRIISQNRKAVSYICSTTGVLNDLVVAARDSIKESLDNGTYSRLVKQGVLTQSDVDAAKKLLTRYEEANVRLSANGACKDIRSTGKR